MPCRHCHVKRMSYTLHIHWALSKCCLFKLSLCCDVTTSTVIRQTADTKDSCYYSLPKALSHIQTVLQLTDLHNAASKHPYTWWRIRAYSSGKATNHEQVCSSISNKPRCSTLYVLSEYFLHLCLIAKLINFST